jgi:hypothetical protein
MGVNNLVCTMAFETPLANLDFSSMFGDYIFALAHLVETEPDYAHWIMNRAEDMELYLDNGAYELGSSIDVKHYASVIESLQPDVAIAPDTMQDREKTIRLSKSFFELGAPKGPKYMIVPQGKTTDEWVLCLHTLVRMFRHEFHMIGIPRCMYPRRLQLARHAQKFTKKPIHLLGCVDPSEIAGILQSNMNVQSLDTSWPARHALGKLGPQDRIDFHTDDLEFEVFQASVSEFLRRIDPRKNIVEDNVTNTVLASSLRSLEREEELEERSQFAPPKGHRIPLPGMEDEEEDQD